MCAAIPWSVQPYTWPERRQLGALLAEGWTWPYRSKSLKVGLRARSACNLPGSGSARLKPAGAPLRVTVSSGIHQAGFLDFTRKGAAVAKAAGGWYAKIDEEIGLLETRPVISPQENCLFENCGNCCTPDPRSFPSCSSVFPICRTVHRYRTVALASLLPILSFKPSPFNQPG